MLNIVLYRPQIPPNTGNIARLCVATGTRLHLIHPLGFKIDDATVKRAGLDYWEHLEKIEYAHWEEFIQSHQRERLFLFSKKVSRPYSQVAYHDGDYLIFGAETFGLPDPILVEFKESTLTIPMWGPTRSLNLASSVALVTYEAIRQITGDFSAPKNLKP